MLHHPHVSGITRIRLTAFRSYEQLNLSCHTGPVILTGENGQGKTNLLEAISLLSPGKGFRGAHGEHLICRQAPQTAWAVAVHVDAAKDTTQLGLGLDPDAFARGREKKIARIDQTNVRSVSQFCDYIQVLWLTPAMDRLLMDAPADRRRFLDRMVYGLDGEQATRIKRYEHALRERMALLKEGEIHSKWLAAIENTMVENGVAITLARHATVEKLTEQLQNTTTNFPRAKLQMTGWMDELLAQGRGGGDIHELYRMQLQQDRSKDSCTGMTRSGPHRSDFTCFFGADQQPAAQCSTGEQKAVLLSIVLAAARMQQVYKRGVPILLLDEVVAHLDHQRRKDLYQEIESLGLQTWMTGTDFKLFQDFTEKAQHFCVENGIVSVKNVL